MRNLLPGPPAHAQGYNMHAMSNYPAWWRLVEERLRLSRFLRWTFVSCRAGVRKPDPAAYAFVVQQLGVPPERYSTRTRCPRGPMLSCEGLSL